MIIVVTEPENLTQLVEAVAVWTGYGREMMPNRDDSKVVRHFGPEVAARLLSVIKALEGDFYLSNARFAAENLAEMAILATADFNQTHPEVPPEIARAFAWCYTFDFK